MRIRNQTKSMIMLLFSFYKKAKANGIKPIIGCEVYTASRTYKDKEGIDKKRSGSVN